MELQGGYTSIVAANFTLPSQVIDTHLLDSSLSFNSFLAITFFAVRVRSTVSFVEKIDQRLAIFATRTVCASIRNHIQFLCIPTAHRRALGAESSVLEVVDFPFN